MADELIPFPSDVIPRSKLETRMPEGAGTPPPDLLRIPEQFQSTSAVLACAEKLDLSNILIVSHRENGNLVFLQHGLSTAECNWLLDNVKWVLASGRAS